MNVAIFASAFYPSLGGVEELVRQLAREYKRQGVNSIVLVNRWPRSLPEFELIEDTPVYRLAMRMPEYNLRVRTNYALAYPWVRTKMLRILRKHKIDLVHVQCVSVNGHYAAVAARALGIPLVVTTQGERTMDAERVYEKSPFLNQTLRRLLANADQVTACSQHTLEDIESFAGGSFGNRGSVIYNAVRVGDFSDVTPFPHSRPYILAIGRMVSQKGFDVLINAFASANIDSHDLLIAGDGPERRNLEDLARKHGVSTRIQFMGRANRPTTVSLFAGCSFFVLPSRQEPFGIVNLEAMAAGKAVVASRTGGVSEIIVDGENGLLVPPGDELSLADAMRCLTVDDSLRRRLGVCGRDRVQHFDWEVIARQYKEIYQLALDHQQAVDPESAISSSIPSLSTK